MKLPISLLVLAAVGQAVSSVTSDTKASSTDPPTDKRELHEGNYGQKTQFLKKYVATEPTPGIQYTDDFKELSDISAPNHDDLVKINEVPLNEI